MKTNSRINAVKMVLFALEEVETHDCAAIAD